jgi:hypothetical protein
VLLPASPEIVIAPAKPALERGDSSAGDGTRRASGIVRRATILGM